MGNHSGDFKDFGGTADSCSPLKSLKNTASPTATPRILEEENQASLSLRADNGGVAIHNQKVDSSNDYSASAEFMDCHAIATALARNDSKNATKQKVDKKADSRIFTQTAQSLNNLQGENAQNAFDSQVAGGRIVR